MKGNEKLLETLNSLLADELTAISQYIVHAEMCESWGYGKLHEHFQKRAVDEMKHAEKLIGRILFLEGRPVVSELRKMSIGETVPKQLEGDRGLEMGAVKAYNEAIALAAQVGDNATKELLDHILLDEDRHIDEIEEKQDQIRQLGEQIFLSVQLGE
jgi:bacterioferritin